MHVHLKIVVKHMDIGKKSDSDVSKYPEHESSKIWIGSKFDPIVFDLRTIQEKLATMVKLIDNYDEGFEMVSDSNLILGPLPPRKSRDPIISWKRSYFIIVFQLNKFRNRFSPAERPGARAGPRR